MKKIRIITILFILTFSFSVKAEVFVEMEIDCNNDKVSTENSVTCEANLVYEDITINDIDLEYDTNLDISFTSISGLNLSKNGNKVSIHSLTPLEGIILDSTVVMKFTLKANNNSGSSEGITLKNIRINKSNEVEIDDVNETFNVEVSEKLDSDCYLTSLSIDKVSVADFDKEKLEYQNIKVNKSVVYIDAARSSDKSSATGLGEVFIKPGETLEHHIIVTAQDNSQKIYKLFITNTTEETPIDEDANTLGIVEEESKDNTLKSLELLNGKEKIKFNFDSKKDKYNIDISDSTIKKITIKATLNSDKATFVDKFGPRDVNLELGNNKVLIKVKSENNEEKVYTLNINLKEEKNTDNTLASLKINDEVVNLVLGVDTYEVVLPKDAEKTKIEAIPTNEKATVNFKDITLVDGNNKVVITVISESEEKKEYQINIVRSDKNNLKAIKIDGYNLGFNLRQTDYVLKIDEEEELKIIITPSNIEYKIEGNNKLENNSIIKIKVVEATGEKEYRIKILKDTDKLGPVVYIIVGLLGIGVIGAIVYEIIKKKKK